MCDKSNSLSNTDAPSRKPAIQIRNTNTRHLLRGLIICHIIMKPITDNRYVLAVLISLYGILNNCPKNTITAMAKKDVIAAGNALYKVWFRKLPSCFYSLGSSASRNAGIPMLNVDISDT